MNSCAAATRRACLTTGLALIASRSLPALAAGSDSGLPADRRLVFDIWRNNQLIGRHTVAFAGAPGDMVISIAAQMVVKLGPIPIFHYRHQCTETWRDGRFASLDSQTVANGQHDGVQATSTSDQVLIRTRSRTIAAPAASLPLTHWNEAALKGPLFNPQTGAVIHKTCQREAGRTATLADGRSVAATGYVLSGDADIVDWYDASAVWTALRGKAPDGSYIDYRRSA